MVKKLKNTLADFMVYWKIPMPGRYMPFKEIAAYAGGGIGAYFIITMGTACLLASNSVILSDVLGIGRVDMQIMYALAVFINILLTGIRANIIDNTRNKAGKYRPYIVRMAIPAAIICNLMVWIPYNNFYNIFPEEELLWGKPKAYVLMCTIVFVLNLLLHFFYYFFYDAYENLIHLLSPNSQERADVASIKSIVYSLAPSIVNALTPVIAGNLFKTTTTDIRVYRLLYPILTVLGLLLCLVVYKHTEEKIVQAKSHVIQINFLDALKAVAKNKYFWIISLAGWIGFLESAYANILFWLYNYGGACSGNEYALIITIYGNASLWGMLAAPFCIRKWGKKMVLVVTNLFNVLFLLLMLPFAQNISHMTIWFIMGCLWLNMLMGSFAHILNPSIQADIRDYQQYVTGERIDGMFSAVATLGTVIALATSFVLPVIYEKYGITATNAEIITANPDILNRVLGDGKTVADILAGQLASGQNNYINPNSALYDTNILLSLIRVLIVVSAFGAFMNVVPYFWYDFNEKKQKSIVNVLKIRAMFEGYSSGVYDNEAIVEGVEIINKSRELANCEAAKPDKKSYKSVKGKAEKRAAKKEYKAALKANEDIEIAKFVCDELDKFSTPEFVFRLEKSKELIDLGLGGFYALNMSELKSEIAKAKAMPKATDEEKKLRTAAVEIAKSKATALKYAKKYYKSAADFTEPDYADLEALYEAEDTCADNLRKSSAALTLAKKQKNKEAKAYIEGNIKKLEVEKKELSKKVKTENDRQGNFARSAKPYIDAKRLIVQIENYQHFDEFVARYDAAKADLEAEREAKLEEQKRLAEEKAAKTAELKAKKEAEKAAKKEKTANKK